MKVFRKLFLFLVFISISGSSSAMLSGKSSAMFSGMFSGLRNRIFGSPSAASSDQQNVAETSQQAAQRANEDVAETSQQAAQRANEDVAETSQQAAQRANEDGETIQPAVQHANDGAGIAEPIQPAVQHANDGAYQNRERSLRNANTWLNDFCTKIESVQNSRIYRWTGNILRMSFFAISGNWILLGVDLGLVGLQKIAPRNYVKIYIAAEVIRYMILLGLRVHVPDSFTEMAFITWIGVYSISKIADNFDKFIPQEKLFLKNLSKLTFFVFDLSIKLDYASMINRTLPFNERPSFVYDTYSVINVNGTAPRFTPFPEGKEYAYYKAACTDIGNSGIFHLDGEKAFRFFRIIKNSDLEAFFCDILKKKCIQVTAELKAIKELNSTYSQGMPCLGDRLDLIPANCSVSQGAVKCLYTSFPAPQGVGIFREEDNSTELIRQAILEPCLDSPCYLRNVNITLEVKKLFAHTNLNWVMRLIKSRTEDFSTNRDSISFNPSRLFFKLGYNDKNFLATTAHEIAHNLQPVKCKDASSIVFNPEINADLVGALIFPENIGMASLKYFDFFGKGIDCAEFIAKNDTHPSELTRFIYLKELEQILNAIKVFFNRQKI